MTAPPAMGPPTGAPVSNRRRHPADIRGRSPAQGRSQRETAPLCGCRQPPFPPLCPRPPVDARQGIPARGPMDAHETDTLPSLRAAAAALGLRPATVKQDIQQGQLAALRVPSGHATRLYVAHVEIDRYRCASLGVRTHTRCAVHHASMRHLSHASRATLQQNDRVAPLTLPPAMPAGCRWGTSDADRRRSCGAVRGSGAPRLAQPAHLV